MRKRRCFGITCRKRIAPFGQAAFAFVCSGQLPTKPPTWCAKPNGWSRLMSQTWAPLQKCSKGRWRRRVPRELEILSPRVCTLWTIAPTATLKNPWKFLRQKLRNNYTQENTFPEWNSCLWLQKSNDWGGSGSKARAWRSRWQQKSSGDEKREKLAEMRNRKK